MWYNIQEKKEVFLLKKQNLMILGITCCICLITIFAFRSQTQKEYTKQYKEGLQLNEALVKDIKNLVSDSDIVVSKSKIKVPKEGDRYATIRVDRVNFKKPLFYGDNDVILNLGIGHYMGSSLPGEGKPILLAGHNGTEFYQLQNMKKGDIVKIETSWGDYTYKIHDMETIDKKDFDATILNEDKNELLMYTCYPFDTVNTPYRYFVYATMVSGPKLEEAS